MRFLPSLYFIIILATSPLTAVASANQIADLEREVADNKYQVNLTYKKHLAAKEKLESSQKKLAKAKLVLGKNNNSKPFNDDIPSVHIFNKNREWNPEKIIWRDNFWECAEYRDNGTCVEVRAIEGFVVE